MPGFGFGPFGNTPFGISPWSTDVLIGLLPAIYIQQDQQQGNVLQDFMQGIAPVFDTLLNEIRDWQSLRDPLNVRTQYDEIETVRLGKVVVLLGPIEQRGVDGTVNAFQQFKSATARFSPLDVGNALTILNSSLSANNRIFKISQFIDANTVKTFPPLVADSGPLAWQVQSVPASTATTTTIEIRSGDVSDVTDGWTLFDGGSEFSVLGRAQFFPQSNQTALLTELEGSQGTVNSSGQLIVETNFSQADVGKHITTAGSTVATNNGRWEIFGVSATNAKLLTLNLPLTISGTSGTTGNVTYTLVAGNANVSVAQINGGVSQLLAVSVNSGVVSVFLATDSSGNVTSTALQVANLVNADPIASLYVTASTTGGGGSLAGVQAATPILGVALSQDSGPLFWARLPFAQVEIDGTALPSGIVVQNGADLSITGPSTLSSLTAQFSASSIGNLITIRGSTAGNSGVYPVTAVLSPSRVQVNASLTTEAGPLYWEARTPTTYGDGTQVQLQAQSLIQWLAQDFGLQVDWRETALRQHKWVNDANQWFSQKGTATSYEIVGKISGFDVTTAQLFRIDAGLIQTLPSAHVYEVGTSATGQSGTTGQLLSTGAIELYDPAAMFTASNVGQAVVVTNAATSPNDQVYTIDSVTNPTTAVFRISDSAVTPDYGVGGTSSAGKINWRVVDVYTDLAPLLTLQDETNNTLLQAIETTLGKVYGVDTYCWETNFSTNVGVSIASISPSSPTGAPQPITVVTNGISRGGGVYASAAVVQAIGRWQFIDSAGQIFYFDSIPAQILTGSGPTPPQVTLSGPTDPYAFVFNITGAGVLGTSTFSWSSDGGVTFHAGGVTAPSVPLGGTNVSVNFSTGTYSLSNSYSQSAQPWTHTFQVVSSLVPAVGAATLSYNCDPQLSCNYCAASVIYANVAQADIVDDPPLAQENAFERILRRLETEVVPIHVRLIVNAIFNPGGQAGAIQVGLTVDVITNPPLTSHAVILGAALFITAANETLPVPPQYILSGFGKPSQAPFTVLAAPTMRRPPSVDLPPQGAIAAGFGQAAQVPYTFYGLPPELTEVPALPPSEQLLVGTGQAAVASAPRVPIQAAVPPEVRLPRQTGQPSGIISAIMP